MRFRRACLSGAQVAALYGWRGRAATALVSQGATILDSTHITGRATAPEMARRTSQELATDIRWLGVGAGLVLTLLAGVMLEMVVEDHSRFSLVWMTAVAALLAGAVASLAIIGVRDADLLWDTRKEAAIARGDAEVAERLADTSRAADAYSRELLQRLQVATVDAMRDPFLADRLARGPRHEQDLLSLLDEVDRHLENRP